MVFFQSSEQRQRHRFVDNSVENYSAILNRNSREDGYIPTVKVDNDRYLLGHLAVPNLRHGTLHMSRKALRDDDYIPIWPLLHGEAVMAAPESSYSLHPIQKKNIADFFLNRKITLEENSLDGILEKYKKLDADATDALQLKSPTTQAFVWRRLLDVTSPEITGKNRIRTMQGRPYVFLAMNNEEGGTPYARSSPDTLSHELTHVRQALAEPVRRHDTAGSIEDLSLRNELGAYRDQEFVLFEMERQEYVAEENEPQSEVITEDGQRLSGVYLINNSRREINQNRRDKLFPDGKLRKRFAELGLDIHFSLSSEVPRHTSFIHDDA